MNKNEIFTKFLQNPLIREKVDLTEKQLQSINLYSNSPNRLIDVIKTTILHLDSDQSTDVVARKINQSFKRGNDMIIKSIAAANFQCYSGKLDQNKFDFRKGLNVVIGDNGSGKSKLYDAFFWVLYDKIFDSSTRLLISTSDVGVNLVSDLAKANCNVGEKIISKVQLTLQRL